MNKKNNAAERLEDLYLKQRELKASLGKLNLSCYDAEQKCKRIESEIGVGRARAGELIDAQNEWAKLKEKRNKKSDEFQDAVSEYENFKEQSRAELFQETISEYEAIEPEHNALIKRIESLRADLDFISKHYIPRGVRKDHGFTVLQGRGLSVSIFQPEDTGAIDVLKGVLNGSITIDEKKRNQFSQVRQREVGSAYNA